MVRPGDPRRDYPPGVSAGADIKTMLPRSGDAVTVGLHGTLSDDHKPVGELTCRWSRTQGPGSVDFEDATAPETAVTLKAPGRYVLSLTASDGRQHAEATVSILVEPFLTKVTRSLSAVDDAYIEGDSAFSNQHLKVEGKRRVSFIKFDLKDLPPTILDVQLRLTGGADSGGGTLRVFDGAHSDWVGTTLTKASAPVPGELLAKESVQVGRGDTVTMDVTPLIAGDGTYTLVLMLDEGDGDIWFSATGSGEGPELLVTFDDPDGHYDAFGRAAGTELAAAAVLDAMTDFEFVVSGDFVPGYKDQNQRAMAINAAQYQDQFAAAETEFKGDAGTFDLVLITLTETDGESSYRLLVAGKKVGEVRNPETIKDYGAVSHRFEGVALNPGDTIRVEFNSASNGKVPEGDAFAFSRGRWRSVTVLPPCVSMNQPKAAGTKPAPPEVVIPPFEYTYDVTTAKKVHQQSGGVVVVEAEDFDAVDHQDHRAWYLTTVDRAPDVRPDPDSNHAAGAVGGAYLEILPDTRVTHADPLVNGVSFAPVGGQCSVLYYPIEFTEPGRYYVWVRMCCTGSEDNGLHVGIDGAWPESGARLQFTGRHGQWQWDSRQRTEQVHTGVLGQIWIDAHEPGLHTIMFSMREDGFEFDRFLLTREQDALESKSPDPGPPASPRR